MNWKARTLGLLVAAASLAWSQDQPPGTPPVTAPPAAPPVLENTGKPMRVPFECTEEDIQTAGLSCSETEPCPVYLELSNVELVGPKIFLAGNLHSQSVTIASVLLGTEDMGHTWREVSDRIPGAALDHIQFVDPLNGWVSGQTVSPLPREPFLLLTTDGGKTWKSRPVFGESAENRFGSIQQYFFSAKDNGSLIVDRGQGSDSDRYELYESPDGGESWNIKQSSTKPIKPKQAAAANPAWRVRADAGSEAFHIEHRQGEKWESVAAFLVKLNPCKPK